MKKRVLPVVAAMVLLLSMPVYASSQPEQPAPITVFEVQDTTDQAQELYPVSVQTAERNGIWFIQRVYEVPHGFDPESLTEPFEQDGHLFSRYDVLKQELPGNRETRLAYQIVSFESEDNDEGKIRQQLATLRVMRKTATPASFNWTAAAL